MRLWDAESGKLLADMKSQEGSVGDLAFSVLDLAFSPDGRRLATANTNHTAGLWDVESGRPIAALRGHVGTVYSVAFSPDGRRLATASWDRTARLWDGLSGQPLAVLRGHTDQVRHSAFSPDGRRLATAGNDSTVRLWDVESGRQLAALKGHTGRLSYVTFSADGRRLATASDDDRTARLWIGRESPEEQEKRLREAHQNWHVQQAAAAENAGDWFAAAFHLRQLILLRPDEADLKERLQIATVKLGK